MPVIYRGFTIEDISLPPDIVIDNLNNAFDGNENTYASVVATSYSALSTSYCWGTITFKLPPNLRFHTVSTRIAVASAASVFSVLPILTVVKTYPLNIQHGEWSTDIIASSCTPFIRNAGSDNTNPVTRTIFNVHYNTSPGTYYFSVKEGDMAFLGGTSTPTQPSLIPQRYKILSEEMTSSSGGILVFGFVMRRGTYPSAGELFRIYDINLEIPSFNGDWYYYVPETQEVVSVTSTLADGNLTTGVGGLNRINKILFCLFPQGGTNIPKLSLHVASETGSNQTIEVYGDTNFDFSGQPITTFTATPAGGWVTLQNLTVNHALQFVPQQTS